jgi:hypothetical protein
MYSDLVEIPIIKTIDSLGLAYKKVSECEYKLLEGWEVTDGWTFNTDENIVKDFSKDRGSGWNLKFVMDYLKLDKKEAIEWFQEKGLLITKKSISDIRVTLPGVSEKQGEYLLSRGIDPEKVKDFTRNYNGAIGCLIYEGDIPRGLNARTLSNDHAKRFIALSGYSTKGVYKHKIDITKKYLIVVEGLIDFLTIRQFETNVIGLKSATDWFEELPRYAWYDIIYIPDNDDVGSASTAKYMQNINHRVFDLKEYETEDLKLKDINDLYQAISCWTEAWDLLINILQENAVYDMPIKPLFKELKERQKTIKERGKLGFDGPIKEIYDTCSWVVEGRTYCICAFSNTGKSKYAYSHIKFFLEQKKKVLFINLEVDKVTCLANIIANVEWVTTFEASSDFQPNEKLYKNLIIKDDVRGLKDIETCIRSYQPDICFIDFVQNVEHKGSDYEKHSAIARWIQRIWIETWCTMFSLAQLPNTWLSYLKARDYDSITPKNAGEYFASSDVIQLLYTETLWNGDKILCCRMIKNKFGEKNNHAWILNMDRKRNIVTYWWLLTDEYIIK